MPTLKKQAWGMVIGLIIQYLLGMYTNMFVNFPESGTERQMWEFARSQTVLVVHILLGIFLLLNSIWMIIRAFRAKAKVWKIPAVIGFLTIFLAAFGGTKFVPTQNDNYSFLMAVAFLVALIAYFWGLYKIKIK